MENIMIDIEMKIKYYNAETFESVEFTSVFNTDATDIETAREYAAGMIETEMKDAYDDGAMMDTFYYEWDMLVPQEILEKSAA
jgi:hypothetical protein